MKLDIEELQRLYEEMEENEMLRELMWDKMLEDENYGS